MEIVIMISFIQNLKNMILYKLIKFKSIRDRNDLILRAMNSQHLALLDFEDQDLQKMNF